MAQLQDILDQLTLGGHELDGGYFRACWGSPGGGSPPASSASQQTFSTTQAIAAFDNPTLRTDGSPNNKVAILDYIRLIVRAADTAATQMWVSGMSDQQPRFSSGGFQPIPPEFGPLAVLDMNVALAMPQLQPHFGPIGLVAGGANRLLTHPALLVKQVAAAPLMSVGDELIFTFQRPGSEPPSSKVGAATTPTRYPVSMGRVTIQPGCNWSMLAWYTAITGGFTFEPEVAWWELNPAILKS